MSKKLLFIAPDYYGFNDVIFEGIIKYTDYEANMAVSATTKRYKYKNFSERLHNFFSKTFLNKNLKNQKKRQHFIRQINQSEKYDIILVNRPDILDKEIFDLLEKKGDKKIVIFWDSFDKIKGQKETLPHFDIKYSFDKDDCETYKLEKINNFYFNKDLGASNSIYDVVYLGTFDNRFDDLLKINETLKKDNINIHSFIYYPPNIKNKKDDRDNITIIPDIIQFSESYKINSRGRIFLDLAHENQSGLSFRPFDALGNRKKLITTNTFIKNYDFYNPNNIFIIEDINNINIPSSFFINPYEDLSDEIYKKYNLKNWINTILDI